MTNSAKQRGFEDALSLYSTPFTVLNTAEQCNATGEERLHETRLDIPDTTS